MGRLSIRGGGAEMKACRHISQINLLGLTPGSNRSHTWILCLMALMGSSSRIRMKKGSPNGSWVRSSWRGAMSRIKCCEMFDLV